MGPGMIRQSDILSPHPDPSLGATHTQFRDSTERVQAKNITGCDGLYLCWLIYGSISVLATS